MKRKKKWSVCLWQSLFKVFDGSKSLFGCSRFSLGKRKHTLYMPCSCFQMYFSVIAQTSKCACVSLATIFVCQYKLYCNERKKRASKHNKQIVHILIYLLFPPSRQYAMQLRKIKADDKRKNARAFACFVVNWLCKKSDLVGAAPN